LDEYALLLLTFFSSILVALVSIKYDRRLKAKEEIKETLNSLLQETLYNLGHARNILEKLNSDIKAIEEREDLAPLPLLSDTAYINATNKGILVALALREAKAHVSDKTKREVKKWGELLHSLQECYAEIRNFNSAVQMREQVKLLTIPFSRSVPKTELSTYFRTETMKYLIEKVSHDISILEGIEKKLSNCVLEELI